MQLKSLEGAIDHNAVDEKTVTIAQKVLKHISNSNQYNLADKDIPLLTEFTYLPKPHRGEAYHQLRRAISNVNGDRFRGITGGMV